MNDTNNSTAQDQREDYWEFRERQAAQRLDPNNLARIAASVLGCDVGDGGAAGGEAQLRRPPADPPLRLESSANNVTSRVPVGVVALPHRCDCRTCPTCGCKLGWRVRQRMLAKSNLFREPRMFTLTLDRSGFASAEAGHDAVMGKRFIARLLRILGIKAWAWVLEFQTKSGEGWPHWHLLIDVADLPGHQVDLKRAWSIWRDKWGLGGIDLRYKRGFNSPEHAVLYITKYLIKMPESFPVWVLKSEKGIRFVGASRAVGRLVSNAEQSGGIASEPDPEEAPRLALRMRRRPLVKRMSECGMSSKLYHVDVDEVTEDRYFAFLRTVPVAPEDLASLSEQGMISMRAWTCEMENGSFVWVDPSSGGGIGGSLKRLAAEIGDREVGYDEWREAEILRREREILTNNLFARRAEKIVRQGLDAVIRGDTIGGVFEETPWPK